MVKAAVVALAGLPHSAWAQALTSLPWLPSTPPNSEGSSPEPLPVSVSVLHVHVVRAGLAAPAGSR